MTALPNPTPTTELQAVNAMLLSIVEAPVNTLSGTNVVDVAVAKKVLSETNVQVQQRGWHFNSESDYPLPVGLNGEITLPANAARVDVNKTARWDIDPVVRGIRLYDKKNHTFKFAATVHADVILLLPFEDLPQAARWLVTVMAVRKFQIKTIGSENQDGFNSKDEGDAIATLEEAEGDNADYSIFDSYGVARVLMRHGRT